MSALSVPRILALLATLLFFVAPGVHAHDAPAPDAEDDAEPVYADLHWLLPEVAYAGHPLHAAYAIIADESPMRLTGHVNVPLTVYLDDQMLWTSDSVHEHDGFHGLVITPPTAGTLRFVAGEAHVGGGKAHGHQGAAMDRNAYTAEPSKTIERTIEVLPSVPLNTTLDPFADEELEAKHGHVHSAWKMGNHGLPFGYLTDVRDPAGRLIGSAYGIHGAGEPSIGHGSTETPATVSFLFTPDPTEPVWYHGREISTEVTPDRETAPFVNPTDAVDARCDLADTLVITDPNSARDERLIWQEWSDIRIALLDIKHKGHYDLGDRPRTHYSLPASGLSLTPGDPFRQIAFRAPTPGDHSLYIGQDDVECKIRFTILPNPNAPVGIVEEAIHVDNDTAHVGLAAVHPDGHALGHYEFDTRVFSLGDDTRLVWQGKLHGHDGAVSFKLAGLAPGDYAVVTYPSPQDMDTGPVATDDPEGFRYGFTIDHTITTGGPADIDTFAPVPGPGLVLTAFALLGVVAALRRR